MAKIPLPVHHVSLCAVRLDLQCGLVGGLAGPQFQNPATREVNDDPQALDSVEMQGIHVIEAMGGASESARTIAVNSLRRYVDRMPVHERLRLVALLVPCVHAMVDVVHNGGVASL